MLELLKEAMTDHVNAACVEIGVPGLTRYYLYVPGQALILSDIDCIVGLCQRHYLAKQIVEQLHTKQDIHLGPKDPRQIPTRRPDHLAEVGLANRVEQELLPLALALKTIFH